MTDVSFMGLDLSLTSSGIAELGTGGVARATHTLKPGVHKGLDRILHLSTQLEAILPSGRVVAALEGYSMGGKFAGMQFDRAEWAGQAKLMLYQTGRFVTLVVPPTTLKIFATGKGNAQKDAMCDAALKQWGPVFKNDDEADALWLAELARFWWTRTPHRAFEASKGKKASPVLPAHPLPFARGAEATPEPVRKRKRTPVR